MKSKEEIKQLLKDIEEQYKHLKHSQKYLLMIGKIQINILRNILGLKPTDWNKEVK